MDDLAQQLELGLPDGWARLAPHFTAPETTRILLCATDGQRTLVFCLVDQIVRSATPLLTFNSQLRDRGFEVVWIFSECCIPSTRHMVCVSAAKDEGEWKARIVNARSRNSSLTGSVSLAHLAQAAAEQRLRVQTFTAGQRITVLVESMRSPCLHCGALVHEVKRATFLPEGAPTAPGLELSKARLGRCVSALIAEAIDRTQKKHTVSEPQAYLCEACTIDRRQSLRIRGQIPSALVGVVLSSSAAYELVKHHQTTWYIA